MRLRVPLLLTAVALVGGCGGDSDAREPAAHGRSGEERPGRPDRERTASAPDERNSDDRGRTRRTTFGRSVRGHPLELVRVGDPASGREVLVVGCIHGDECEGTAIARRLERRPAPRGARLAIVEQLNPDGFQAGTRQNSRGVDLNRNFPSEWRQAGRPFDHEYSGPGPLSEAESRAAAKLVRRLRPDITIWYHQPEARVRAFGPSVLAARRYARLAGVRYDTVRWPAGTAPNWQNHRFRDDPSFVVELPPGALAGREADRHVRAVRRLARLRDAP